jgi:hypothetical protein
MLLLGTQDKPISQHLTNLSKLSHILLVVYRRRGTPFCPAQTYENIQPFVVAHYKSVAQQKAEGAHEYFIFQDSDDRLENYFGVMRTLVAAQPGFDMLMAEDRIGATPEIAQICEDNPTWAPHDNEQVCSEDAPSEGLAGVCYRFEVKQLNELACSYEISEIYHALYLLLGLQVSCRT